jgi:hypothetical protein
MAKYNGHKSWGYWNVSLWLGNDEGLYLMAKSYIRGAKNRDEAARLIVGNLADQGITKTPDGANYSISAVRSAITGL